MGVKKWPVSIKNRILELCRLGVGPSKIEEITGIAYTTQLKWRKEANLPVRGLKRGKKKKFHEVSLVPTTVVGSPKPTTVVTSKTTKEVIKSNRSAAAVTFKFIGLEKISLEPFLLGWGDWTGLFLLLQLGERRVVIERLICLEALVLVTKRLWLVV